MSSKLLLSNLIQGQARNEDTNPKEDLEKFASISVGAVMDEQCADRMFGRAPLWSTLVLLPTPCPEPVYTPKLDWIFCTSEETNESMVQGTRAGSPACLSRIELSAIPLLLSPFKLSSHAYAHIAGHSALCSCLQLRCPLRSTAAKVCPLQPLWSGAFRPSTSALICSVQCYVAPAHLQNGSMNWEPAGCEKSTCLPGQCR